MTVEEQIAAVAANQERMQRDFDRRQERIQEDMQKTQTILASVLDSIQRLERIALSHEVRLQDTEAALAALEGKQKRSQ